MKGTGRRSFVGTSYHPALIPITHSSGDPGLKGVEGGRTQPLAVDSEVSDRVWERSD